LAALGMAAGGAPAAAEPAAFRLHAPQAQSVQLAGSFDGWKERHLLRREADGRHWSVTLDLPPGRYEYLYRVDEDWRHDPAAASLDDGLGGRNNALIIPVRE
jgi:1,4-alpha-glucan branching enzyme